MIRKIFAVMILATVLMTGCGLWEDSPEAALNEIIVALATKKEEKLAVRADLDEFFSETYDTITIELAKKYDEYKEKYPKDEYFQHSAEFLTEYNMSRKATHLKFLDDVKESFFAEIPEPEKLEENPTAYVANEFEKIRRATKATIKETRIDNKHATITLLLEGDDSLQGKFIGEMTLKLGFSKDSKDNWHFDKIENLDELMPVLVDKAERAWINL